jgi:hypothetical protein
MKFTGLLSTISRGSRPFCIGKRSFSNYDLKAATRRPRKQGSDGSKGDKESMTSPSTPTDGGTAKWAGYAYLFAAIGGASLLMYADRDPERVDDESRIDKKREADKLSGVYGANKGMLSRVRQVKRLPLDLLDKHHVSHGKLEGIVWHDDTLMKKEYWVQPYYNDEAAYEIDTEGIEMLNCAAQELHAMCLEAVDLVVESPELMDVFEIPENLRDALKQSWNRKDRDFLGRFDFLWDGVGQPKMVCG